MWKASLGLCKGPNQLQSHKTMTCCWQSPMDRTLFVLGTRCAGESGYLHCLSTEITERRRANPAHGNTTPSWVSRGRPHCVILQSRAVAGREYHYPSGSHRRAWSSLARAGCVLARPWGVLAHSLLWLITGIEVSVNGYSVVKEQKRFFPLLSTPLKNAKNQSPLK